MFFSQSHPKHSSGLETWQGTIDRQVTQLIQRNAEFLNEFGLMTTVVSASSDGRPGLGRLAIQVQPNEECEAGEPDDLVSLARRSSTSKKSNVFLATYSDSQGPAQHPGKPSGPPAIQVQPSEECEAGEPDDLANLA